MKTISVLFCMLVSNLAHAQAGHVGIDSINDSACARNDFSCLLRAEVPAATDFKSLYATGMTDNALTRFTSDLFDRNHMDSFAQYKNNGETCFVKFRSIYSNGDLIQTKMKLLSCRQ